MGLSLRERSILIFTGEGSMARHISGIDIPSQWIITSEILHQGSVLSFAYRNPKAAEKDLKLMLHRLKKKNDEIPTFGIYFNCASNFINKIYHL